MNDESDSDVESLASIDDEIVVAKLIPSGEAKAHIEASGLGDFAGTSR
jgi:hypothetical protein